MSVKRNLSYWETELLPREYDLVVIGAGITGQSAAYFFKQQHPDARVLVIERGEMPAGASTRNAGFACIGTVGEHLADRTLESDQNIKDRIRSRIEGLELLLHTLGREVIDFEPVGGYEIFTSESDFQKAADHIDQINGWMMGITGKEAFYKADRYNGYRVIRNEYEGVLHPGKMIRAFTRLNERAGVEFRWNTPVSHMDQKQKIVYSDVLPVSKSELLLIAANAFTDQLVKTEHIRPARGYVFITSALEHIEWKGSFHFEQGYIYFRHLGKDRMLIGGARHQDMETEETTQFGINPLIRDYLVQFSNEVLKLPEGWTIEQEWSGIMGFTSTKSPLMHTLLPGVWVAAGLSGMGVAIGSAIGWEMAQRMSPEPSNSR